MNDMKDLHLERAGALALGTLFGYKPAISRGIMEALGGAAEVFSLSPGQLDELFGPYNLRQGISPEALDRALSELERLESRGYRFVAITEDEYPKLLKECEDAPAGLYIRGSAELGTLFNGSPCISVVGTRDISPYGEEWGTRIVRSIAQAPSRPTIVSGLAIGVDVTAHLAALAEGVPTIAVLPTGIEDIYPARHRVVAEKIASAQGSALITDFPPGTGPQAVTFLRRNRIIAGMSRATILIESKAKGGGTMTARLAAGYGRDVFCLPGRLDDIRSQGCNRLIAEKIAEPIYSLDALTEGLGLGRYDRRRQSDLEEEVRSFYHDSPQLDRLTALAAAIRSRRGIDIEELGRLTGIGYPETLALVRLLQADGFVSTDLLQRCTINPGRVF